MHVFPYTKDALFLACSSELFSLERVNKHERAHYLHRYLDRLGAATLVVEEHYTDGDYLDDYANYYVRSFRDYARRCKRLHFFSTGFDSGSLREMLRGRSYEALQANYLGFSVIRPLPNAIFGRTVLKTYPESVTRKYPATRPYAANLYGAELTVDSLAFQEQDTVVAACATVALWSAFQKTSELFGSRRPTPAEITRLATASTFHSRPMPSRGLSLAQMARAIKDVGLEPEVIEARPGVPMLSLIYGYLTFGIPVVLGIEIEGHGAHAVTVTGYSLTDSLHLTYEHENPPHLEPNRIGLRIDQLFLHDDGFGPFVKVATVAQKLPVKQGSVIRFEGTWNLPSANGKKPKPAKLVPLYAIVPTYHKIRLTFLDVQPWIVGINSVALQTMANRSASEWETCLISNSQLKHAVKDWGLGQAKLEEMLYKPLPRFLWRATLRISRAPALELIFDATGIARSFSVVAAVFRHEGFREAMKPVLQQASVRGRLSEAFTDLLITAAE